MLFTGVVGLEGWRLLTEQSEYPKPRDVGSSWQPGSICPDWFLWAPPEQRWDSGANHWSHQDKSSFSCRDGVLRDLPLRFSPKSFDVLSGSVPGPNWERLPVALLPPAWPLHDTLMSTRREGTTTKKIPTRDAQKRSTLVFRCFGETFMSHTRAILRSEFFFSREIGNRFKHFKSPCLEDWRVPFSHLTHHWVLWGESLDWSCNLMGPSRALACRTKNEIENISGYSDLSCGQSTFFWYWHLGDWGSGSPKCRNCGQ